MEHMNQLMAWKEQLENAEPGRDADIHVTGRLLRHGIEATETLTAITKWLEGNQPDVFVRGLWDAILPRNVKAERTTLCWSCNTVYPIVDVQCQHCGATNANRDPETAAVEVRAKKFDRGGQRNENNEGDPL